MRAMVSDVDGALSPSEPRVLRRAAKPQVEGLNVARP
jgi:hypothetical protein